MKDDRGFSAAGNTIQNDVVFQRLTDDIILLFLDGRNDFLQTISGAAGKYHLQDIVLDIDLRIEHTLEFAFFDNILAAMLQIHFSVSGGCTEYHFAKPLLIEQRSCWCTPVEDDRFTFPGQTAPSDIVAEFLIIQCLIQIIDHAEIRTVIHLGKLQNPLISTCIISLLDGIGLADLKPVFQLDFFELEFSSFDDLLLQKAQILQSV